MSVNKGVHQIPKPQNDQFLSSLLAFTPARLGVWRAGTRPLTPSLLKFRADHAAAQDAVNGCVAESLLEGLKLPVLQTMVRDKDEYLTRPDLGRKLSQEGKAYLAGRTQDHRQVQLVISDGLSSQAIEANLEDFIAAFEQGLTYHGITGHLPFFVQYGRVRLLEDISTAVRADVYVILVGERPGLVTAKSMSAYMVYRPNADTVDADYLVVSNIHEGGTPAAEGAAHVAGLVEQILKTGASGIGMKEKIKAL